MANGAAPAIGVAVVALSAALAGPVAAASPTAQQILSQYNLVTSGNLSTTSAIEGSIVIGGTLQKGASMLQCCTGSEDPTSLSVYLFGSLASPQSGLNIKDPGVAVVASAPTFYYNGSVNPPQVNFSGRSTKQAMPAGVTLADYTTPLNDLETSLYDLTAVGGSYTAKPNKLVFDVHPVNNLTVIDLPLTTLKGLDGNANPSISFTGDLSGDSTTIVINVTGAAGKSFDATESSVNFNSTTYEKEHVIWNFYGATSLRLKSWGGAILAGDASVSADSALNGLLYAKNYNGNGALRYYQFQGDLPAAAIPELSTWAMLGAGFGGLGLAGARRRRAPAIA